MTTALATTNGAQQIDNKSLLALVTEGDCGKLDDAQKLAYYRARCDAAGLDWRAQPFQFVKLNNKIVLYALKACSDQLAAKHGIRVHIVGQETTADGLRVVTVRAATKDGRETDDIGAVNVKGLSGEALANALMKAATKAKRRAVLSVCGLGMLDETEIESIPRAAPVKLSLTDDGAVTVDGRVLTDTTLEAELRASVEAKDRVRLPGGGGAPQNPGVPGPAGSLPVAASTNGAAGLARGEGAPSPVTTSPADTVQDTTGQSGQPLPPGPSKLEQLLAMLDEVRIGGGWDSKIHRNKWCAKYDAALKELNEGEKATVRGAIEVCGYRKQA